MNVPAQPNPAVLPRLLVQDSFTGADGTALVDHTPDTAPAGSAWANDVGTPTLQGNQVSHSGDNKSYLDCLNPNGLLRASVALAAGGTSVGFCFRYLSATDRWLAQLYLANLMRILERVGGSWITRAEAAISPAAETPYTIELYLEGATSRLAWSGSEIRYDGDASYGCSLHGIRINGGTMDWFQFIAP